MIKPVNFFDINMGQMPTTLPLLPLADMVLMPDGKFSIRLTDFRQISMIFWALAHGRMVATIQRKSDKKVYSKGCAARICGFNENEDDSLMVYLMGVCRFDVVREDVCDSYPVVVVNYAPFASDMTPAPEIEKRSLLYALDIYLKTKHIDIKVDLLENLPVRRLVATIASILPFEAPEKQALLECGDLQQCVKTLQTILRMNTAIDDEEKRGRKC
ncbi:MAG: LON peptidase substrate-binding domain-containing protein, partial [Alphaproteobacteria bacterium]|nr:LON peptidase substrate-binding domain-containing protein [Alphaproteobacteria bacterium]